MILETQLKLGLFLAEAILCLVIPVTDLVFDGTTTGGGSLTLNAEFEESDTTST